MSKLSVTKYVNEYIRKEMNMSVSYKLHQELDKAIVDRILEPAKQRALLDKRKTILPKDL